MGQIRADLQLNCDKFLGSIKTVNEAIESLHHHALALAGGFEGLKLGAEAVSEQFEKMSEAIELGAQLQDLSSSTGQSVGDLIVLRQAFTNAGLGADAVQPALRGLSKALSGLNEDGEPTKAVFDKLGVSIHALRAMTAVQQIATLQAAFREMPNAADRAKAAMDLFGKSGMSMLAVLRDPEAIDIAREQVGDLGTTLQDNAQAFKEIEDAVNGLKLKFTQFYAGVASGVAGPGGQALRDLSKLDFTAVGNSIGNLIGKVLELAAVLHDNQELFSTVLGILNPGAAVGVKAIGFLAQGHPVDQANESSNTAAAANEQSIRSVSSEKEREELMKRLNEQAEEVRKKIAGIDRNVSAKTRAGLTEVFEHWYSQIEADKKALEQIPPAILAARDAQKHYEESLEASAKKVEDPEKAYAKLKEEREKAVLEQLPPEEQEKVLLRSVAKGSVSGLDTAIDIYQSNLQNRQTIDPDGLDKATLDEQQRRLEKMLEVRHELIAVEKRITDERKRQAEQAAKDHEKAEADKKKLADFDRKTAQDILKLRAEGRGDKGEVDRIDRQQRYDQEFEAATNAGKTAPEAKAIANAKVQAQDAAKAEQEREKEKPEKTSVFADSDRRVGLGGIGVAAHTDPLVKAHQDATKATQGLKGSIDKLSKQLEKNPERIITPGKPVFQ
ncbi:MAG: hypothetical protein P4L99_28125 [Chthoniobacter sp.]|nr:hypothetical protein [Chthoniobacter sp.]